MKTFLLLLCCLSLNIAGAQDSLAFKNANLPLNTRLSLLLNVLSTEEKISLLGYESPEIKHLQIPAYNWWNESLHGVARAGQASVFPQAIGMAASFNPNLLQEVADIISTEARAKYNLAREKKEAQQYMGLTFWSPNINIYRDPRWGRGQETYGEDPFLTAQMGMAYVRGMQGPDPNHLKVAACAKHFAVHSGPEPLRHSFNASVSEKDLRETYLYAFQKMAQTKVEAVMCAYNRVNGEPCCTNQSLLRNILRNEFGFSGHIVTDCWALEDIRSGHKIETDGAVIAAKALKAGVNLDCSHHLQTDLKAALERNLISLADLDSALAPNLRTLFKLGLLDANPVAAYRTFGQDSVSNFYHRETNRKMARESMVLLKNNGILPLDKSKLNSLMVLGPNAGSTDVLLGNYHGVSGNSITFLEGITEALGAGVRVEYDQGCDYRDENHFGGLWAAGNAELSIAFMGYTPSYEGEEGDAFLSRSGGDRITLKLPSSQIAFLRNFKQVNPNKKLILVLCGGSSYDLSDVDSLADAILLVWYPGDQGGKALADLLFGAYSPSGKLPISYYKEATALPNFENYQMKGRTYRFETNNIAYPFGFGLSYSTFTYQWLNKPFLKHDSVCFKVLLKNAGTYEAQEVVQVYVSKPGDILNPMRELKAFQKVLLKPGEEKTVNFSIPIGEFYAWNQETHSWKLSNLAYKLVVGAFAGNEILTESIHLNTKHKGQ